MRPPAEVVSQRTPMGPAGQVGPKAAAWRDSEALCSSPWELAMGKHAQRPSESTRNGCGSRQNPNCFVEYYLASGERTICGWTRAKAQMQGKKPHLLKYQHVKGLSGACTEVNPRVRETPVQKGGVSHGCHRAGAGKMFFWVTWDWVFAATVLVRLSGELGLSLLC